MQKRKLLILSAFAVTAIIAVVVIWGGLKFLRHYEWVLHRVSALESFTNFATRSMVGESLRHQLTAPKARFLQPERNLTLPVNGQWRQIGGGKDSGGWDAGEFLKTKALAHIIHDRDQL